MLGCWETKAAMREFHIWRTGVVVAAVAAIGFQQLHQRFVGQGVEHQLQALEITELLDAVPAKEERI